MSLPLCLQLVLAVELGQPLGLSGLGCVHLDIC